MNKREAQQFKNHTHNSFANSNRKLCRYAVIKKVRNVIERNDDPHTLSSMR